MKKPLDPSFCKLAQVIDFSDIFEKFSNLDIDTIGSMNKEQLITLSLGLIGAVSLSQAQFFTFLNHSIRNPEKLSEIQNTWAYCFDYLSVMPNVEKIDESIFYEEMFSIFIDLALIGLTEEKTAIYASQGIALTLNLFEKIRQFPSDSSIMLDNLDDFPTFDNDAN